MRKFFDKNTQDEAVNATVGARPQNLAQLSAHLARRDYEDFRLTDAVRPGMDTGIFPVAGFRHDFYTDETTGQETLVIIAAVSREWVVEMFLNLLQPLGDEVSIRLEKRYHVYEHIECTRDHVDLSDLRCVLEDFADVLLNDGSFSVAVSSSDSPKEVQLDDHKLLYVYGENTKAFERRLQWAGIMRDEQMSFLPEGEHFHCSLGDFGPRLAEFESRLGLADDESQNW
jgi:hypothetical protein